MTHSAQHYLVSWYDDVIHEYGYNQVDEYFLTVKDRGLILNINKNTKEQHVFFCNKPRTEYSINFSIKVQALTDEVFLSDTLVDSCFKIASLREQLEQLEKSIKIPLNVYKSLLVLINRIHF